MASYPLRSSCSTVAWCVPSFAPYFGFIPPRYHRALYSIVSGLVLAGVVMLWQRSDEHLLVLEGPFLWSCARRHAPGDRVVHLGRVHATWLGFSSGLAPLQTYLRGSTEPVPVFIVQGPYRWMRHPWYLGAIMLFWSGTDLTADRLLFNILWTGWICVGARLEEADLLREFGDAYERYRRQVPLFVPWRGPVRM